MRVTYWPGTAAEGTVAEESEVLSEEILRDLSDSPQEPVLEIEIIHPSFLKSRVRTQGIDGSDVTDRYRERAC